MQRVLLLDIETAPNLAYVWGMWRQDVRLSQMVSTSSTLCWAAKWLDSDKVMFSSVKQHGHERMLERIHSLLGAADVVVHYNGRKFDIPTLNKEFLTADMAPPAPYRQVDLLSVVRRRFRFQSNRLDFVAQQLGLGGKVKHEGFQLWVSCMHGDRGAWKRMRSYNEGDVRLLEKLYRRVLPWVPNHPKLSDVAMSCTNCGGTQLQSRGTAVSARGRYSRFQCTECGTWVRGSVRTTTPAGERTVQL